MTALTSPPVVYTDTLPLIPAELATGDKGWSQPFCVLTAGEWDRGQRKLTITQADLDQAVSRFREWQAQGVEVPVDYDHSFYERGDSRAAGWYRELFRDGDRLMARVEWTATARAAIEAKEYRYFSAEFSTNHVDNQGKELGFTLLSGGLTNRPFLKGMGAVALAEKPDQSALAWLLSGAHERHPIMAGSATTPEQPTEQTVTLSDHQAVVARADAADKRADAADARVEALTETVTALTDKVSALTDQVKTATERADRTEAELTQTKFTAAISKARREGRLDATDASLEKWNGRLERLGLDETLSLLADLPQHIPVGEIGHGQDKPLNGKAPKTSALFKDAADKFDSVPVADERYALHEQVVAYQREHNQPDYAKALDAVLGVAA